MSDCQAVSEFRHACKGRRKNYAMDVYWQPIGKGSFRVSVEVTLCEEHKELIGDGSYCHAAFSPKKARRH